MCLACLVSILIAILSLAFVKEPYREALHYVLKLDRMFAKESVIATVAILLLAISFSCTAAYIVLYGNALSVDNMGAYFSVYAGCLLLTRPIFGRLSDEYGAPHPALRRCVLCGILCRIAFASDFGGFMIAAVLGFCRIRRVHACFSRLRYRGANGPSGCGE